MISFAQLSMFHVQYLKILNSFQSFCFYRSWPISNVRAGEIQIRQENRKEDFSALREKSSLTI